jgi:hypothetical protein
MVSVGLSGLSTKRLKVRRAYLLFGAAWVALALVEYWSSLRFASEEEGLYALARAQSLAIVFGMAFVISQGQARALGVGASFAAIVIVALGVINVWQGTALGLQREVMSFVFPTPRSTGIDASDGKLATVMLLALGMTWVLDRPKLEKLVVAAALLLSVFLFQSRSQFASLGAGALTWFLMSRGTRTGVVVAALSLLVLLVGYGGDLIRLVSGEGILEYNILSRGSVITEVLSRWASSFEAMLFGVGIERAKANQATGLILVHNTFVLVLVRSGIFAALLLLAAIALSFRRAAAIFEERTVSRKIYASVAAGMLAEHCLYPGFYNEAFLFWLILPFMFTTESFGRDGYRDRAPQQVALT